MVPQKNREPRILKSNLDSTFKPVYVCCVSPDMEADYIAEEIAYLKSLPHNLYRYSDFVIIIRVGHVTRSLEKGLMRRRIPYRVVKGKAFWEKDEVTLMVDFLRVFAYANDIQAITRVVTGCTEGIGPSRKQKLIEFFELKLKQGIFPLEALIGYIDGTYKGLTLTAKSKKSLETLLLQLNRLYEIYNRDSDDKIVVLELFDKIKTLDVFQQLFQDKEGSSENVGEVRSYLSEFVPELEVADTNDHVPAELEPEPLLSKFLQSIDLFLQHNNDATDKLTDQRVSISTIHAAKGLEWPVVFAPCLANGILPVGKDFSEESPEEERRVLYVATTRAKHLLYLSFAPRSFSFGANESSFLTSEVKAGTSDFQTAMSTTESLETLYKIRGIEPPKNTSLQLHVSKYKLLSSSRESEGISGETAGPQPKGIDMIGAVHVAIFPTRNLSLPPVPNFAPKLFAPSASTISSGVNSERVVLAPGIVKAKNSETKRRKTLGVRRR
jgi:DNA helicase-2/ATP-dependent DNA helicase PcrA